MNRRKLIVSLDASLPIFGKRLTRVMAGLAIETEELTIPSWKDGVLGLLGWAWKVYRSKSQIVHYLFGSYHPLIYIIPKLLGKKVIVQWIGSDVMDITSNKEGLLRKIAYRMVDLHLADFAPLADELEPLGINATVISLPPDIPLVRKDIAWSIENRVFVYMPEASQELYGSKIVFRLLKEMPDIEFLITRHSGKDAPELPNVKYLGWVDDIESIWGQVKIYLRSNKHDGLSHTVVEALARAKHVIWSYEYPYCHQAHTFEEARDAIRDILEKNHPNIDGMNYVYERFEPSRLAQDYRCIYLEVLGGKHGSR